MPDAKISLSDIKLSRFERTELLKIADDIATEGDKKLAETLRYLVACAGVKESA